MIKLQKSTFFNEADTKEKLCKFITEAPILSMGAECKKFEAAFSVKQKRKHSIFVNSGSSANLILVQAYLNLGRLKKGDIVGVSALTWATNIMPLIQLGLQPFLIDCELDSLNVSLKTFKQALNIQPNIKGFFITNTLGHCDDVIALADYCKEKNILFFEDNCESLGSIVGEKLLGNIGDASTFSLFVGHHLSAIEGGVVCTDDTELAEAVTMCRAHGWDRSISSGTQSKLRKQYDINEFYAKYTFYDLAYNVRPTEVNGFLGSNQLQYWDAIVQKRQENFLALHDVIKTNPDLVTLRYEHMDLVSSFAIPVIVKDADKIKHYIKKFEDGQVEIRPMIAGSMARQPFYRKYIGNPGNQPNAEWIHRNSFYFGNNPELTDAEIGTLRSLLQKL